MNTFIKLLSFGAIMFSSIKYVAAQYGAVVDFEPYAARHKYVKFVSKNNEPIKGLKVTAYFNNDSVIKLSDKNGIVTFKNGKNIKLNVQDTDKEKNKGQFMAKDTILTDRKYYKIFMRR